MKPLQILFVLSLFCTITAARSEDWVLEPLGSFEFHSDLPALGGLSAIKIGEFGKSFLTISDRGQYFEGNILRNERGSIINMQILKSGPLLDSEGNDLTGRNTDSESITTAKPKGFYISYESNHRIMFHRNLREHGSFLPKHKDFKQFKSNKGLEAIATNSKGVLYAIPEEPLRGDSDFPIYSLQNEKWSLLARFPQSNSFLVTDAVFLPNNDLLILERDYSWAVGFKMQLRVLNLVKNTITGQTVLLSINSGLHNHEGLSIWQDDSDNFFITSISDNNFLPYIASEIKEFRLKKLVN